jgi:hypothetical protein
MKYTNIKQEKWNDGLQNIFYSYLARRLADILH